MPIPLSVLLAWFFCVSGIGATWLLFVVVRLWNADRSPASSLADPPALSILKPFDGVDPGLADNFRTALRASYAGQRELLLCTDEDNAAGIEVARLVIEEARALGIPAELVLTAEGPDSPPLRKVRHLEAGLARARHAVLVNADSTTRLVDGDLDALVGALLREDRCGAAYASYVVRDAQSLGARLMRVAFSASPFSFVAIQAVRGLAKDASPFLVGGLVAFRRAALERIGGFRPFGDYLTEDLPLAAALGAEGWTTATSPRSVLRHLPRESVRSHYGRVVRWNVGMRAMREPFLIHYPIAQFPMVLSGLVLPLACLQLPEHARILSAAFGVLLLSRQLLAAQIVAAAGSGPGWFERLWAVPANELVMAVAFVHALFTRTVVWRGVPLRVLKGGRVEAMRPRDP